MAYRLTARALRDLDNLTDFGLDRWGAVRTRDYVERLRDVFGTIADMPGIGRARAELGHGVRSFPVGSHIVVYRTDAGELIILAIPHQSVDPESHL